MYARQTTSEYTYTLSEARNIIENERTEKRKQVFYMLFQRILGLFALIISAFEIISAYQGKISEGGAFLIMIPLGLYLLFTKKII